MEKTLKFIRKVENVDNWNDIEIKEYQDNLADYGLDYNSYDDPDIMWNDFLNKVIEYNIKYIEHNSDYIYIYIDTPGDMAFDNGNEIISIYDDNNDKVKVIENLEQLKNIICD